MTTDEARPPAAGVRAAVRPHASSRVQAPSSTEFDRTPPQDLSAEQSVLGGMLLSKDAIADVVELLRSSDFYRPAHATIFDTILDLYGKGDPADAITVSAALTAKGEIARIGGAPYLHTLISMVPTAAHAAYYARIVAERAILRRLVEAGTRIVQLGYGAASGNREVDDVVDMAQQAVYDVTEQRTSEDYIALSELLQPTMDEIEAIGTASGVMSGVPTGFVDLDRLTNGLHPGQLIVIAARPGLGKSTVSLDIARCASIKNTLPSVIFSLEMSKTEITMRLLSAESRVPLHNLRTGRLSDEDWTKLARRMGEVSEAPLFIDDSPNLTMMEIRAKARRLRQRQQLRLIVVDYLQLMTSPKRVENRQQEVAELSRGLKLLAKELEVPVIAVSQLNRGPEQRNDKRPLLSDLRESGCLPRHTRILRADTGNEVTLGELLDTGARDIPVWSLDESLRYVPRVMTHVFSSGTKEVYSLRLASGKQLELTANHPLLTVDGWVPLGELTSGSRIAVPRHIPQPSAKREVADSEVIRNVGVFGARNRQAALCLAGMEDQVSNSNRDTVPVEVWSRVRTVLSKRGMSHRAFATALGSAFNGSGMWKHAPNRTWLQRISVVLEDRDLELLATNDVYWDEIISIEPLGVQEVFDATVVGTHNFVANGIAVHNSIEQDSDMVILLHRDDYYEKDSPRAGEADLIVAKHRNGPTDTVTVAFQGHFSRFVDMSTTG